MVVALLLQGLDHQVAAVLRGGFSRRIPQDLKCKSDITVTSIIFVIYQSSVASLSIHAGT